MNYNIKEIKSMIQTQRSLDKAIFEKHNIKSYPVHNMRIALFVELGELMNELPTKFKHWKSTAVDNREKALVEYVDCLHFALSLTYNVIDTKKTNLTTLLDINPNVYFDRIDKCVSNTLLAIVCSDRTCLAYLLNLGDKLGFTWEEIKNTYYKKNEVNFKRQEENY